MAWTRLCGMAMGGLLFAIPAQAQQASGPKPIRPSSWISPSDYPRAAADANVRGTTYFQLDVDAQGAVTRCVITTSSESALLDRTSCAIMLKRGKFKPARDATGANVAGTWSSRINWGAY